MSYLAQNSAALLYILHAVALSLFLLTGSADTNTESPASQTYARVADSSAITLNGFVRHASVEESEAFSGGTSAPPARRTRAAPSEPNVLAFDVIVAQREA